MFSRSFHRSVTVVVKLKRQIMITFPSKFLLFAYFWGHKYINFTASELKRTLKINLWGICGEKTKYWRTLHTKEKLL